MAEPGTFPIYGENEWTYTDPSQAGKAIGTLIPGLASAAITNLAPDPRLTDITGGPAALNYIPFTGAVEGLAGTGGLLYDLSTKLVNKAFNTNLPSAPAWMGAAGQHWGTTADEVFTQLPHYQPTEADVADPAYQDALATSQMIGAALPVAPGGALASLPRGVRGAAEFLTPVTQGTGARVAVAGSLGPTLASILTPSQAQAAPPGSSPLGFNADALLNQPPPQQQPPPQDQPKPPAAQPLGFDPTQMLNPQTPGAGAPTFGEEGESGITWKEAGLGLTAIIAAMVAGKYVHGLGADVTAATRDMRMNDPGYASQVQDFNDARIRIQGGSIEPSPQAPLPDNGVVNRVATSAAQNNLDQTAMARNYLTMTSDSPQAAELLAHKYSNTYNDGVWQSKLREMLSTGHDQPSGLSMPSWEQTQNMFTRLSDDQQRTWTQGMSALNEIDNRGLTGNVAHDFSNVSTADLAAYGSRMMADPQLADLANRYWRTAAMIPQMGEARGFFTPNEAADLISQHPHYVPEANVNGEIMHALGPRSTTPLTGIDTINTSPMTVMAQHIESIMRQMDIADGRRMIVDHQLDLQNMYPNSATVLEKVPNPYPAGQTYSASIAPAGSGAREPIVMVRRGTGIDFYRSNSPEFTQMANFQNANKQAMWMDTVGGPRRWLQAGTTGIMSLLSGRAFPITHLARTAFMSPINRAPGTAGGLMDLAMQRATGGRLGYRGIDPTNLLGGAYSGARSAFDDLMLQASKMFDKSNPEFPMQVLKNIVTPARMDVISNTLRDYYMGTTTHEMRASGAAGMGVPYRVRPPAYGQVMNEGKPIRLISAEMAPRLYMNNSMTGAIRPHLIDVRRALENAYGDLMDAGQQYYYRLNKAVGNVDPQTLTYETRALMGDPSTRGSGMVARAAQSTIPYFNISAQGTARVARSFAQSPVGTSGALFGSLGMLGLLSLYTSMQNPQTRDYLQNIITTQSRAANVHIFGSPNPSLVSSLSLPQEVRPFYPPVLDLLSKVLNFQAVGNDPEYHDKVLGFLKDMFSEHVENSTWQSALQGLADQFNFFDLPSALNVPAELAGNASIRISLERIVNDALSSKGITRSTFVMPGGTDRALPNHPVGDSLFEGQDARVLRNAVSYALGTLSYVADDVMGFGKHYEQAQGPWQDRFFTAAGQTGRDWLQHAMDLNPGLNNVLWENPARESMRPPIVESVERRLDNMRLTTGGKRQELMEGTTGGARPLPVTPQAPGEGKVPPITDPAMRDLYFTTGSTFGWIQSKAMADINALKKQMQDTSNQSMDNRTKREWMNNQTRVIADKYRFINSLIDDANAKLSNKYGRSIDIGGAIDWNKPFDENFPPPK